MKYEITKKSPDNDRIYHVLIFNDVELADHIIACFKYTNEKIISVINLGD